MGVELLDSAWFNPGVRWMAVMLAAGRSVARQSFYEVGRAALDSYGSTRRISPIP
jgi:hypothetical protein